MDTMTEKIGGATCRVTLRDAVGILSLDVAACVMADMLADGDTETYEEHLARTLDRENVVATMFGYSPWQVARVAAEMAMELVGDDDQTSRRRGEIRSYMLARLL